VLRTYNVVSAHLDDAALSCSLLLAANPGSRITTVFAGGPPAVRPLTQWDRQAGYFADGADVTGVRRGEDISAAAMVHASARHLTYWDRQYRSERYGYAGPSEEELAVRIADELVALGPGPEAGAWVIPLGLGHPDHRITAEAGLMCAERQRGDVCYLYEELPYAVEAPSDVADRKRYLAQRRFALEEDDTLEFLDDRALKAAAFRCHASQQRLLRRRARAALRARERIWRLDRR
jgi:LmbE family N-acetylglucosaminyl deacetylase